MHRVQAPVRELQQNAVGILDTFSVTKTTTAATIATILVLEKRVVQVEVSAWANILDEYTSRLTPVLLVVAPAGSSCSGATIASGTWHVSSSSTPYAEASSFADYASASSSSYGDNMYAPYPTPDSSSRGYRPGKLSNMQICLIGQKLTVQAIGTGPPGWPSPTRTLNNYGGSPSSSTYVELSAGASAGPRYGLDAAALALAAVGMLVM